MEPLVAVFQEQLAEVAELLDACLADLDAYRGRAPVRDDVTIMAIRRG